MGSSSGNPLDLSNPINIMSWSIGELSGSNVAKRAIEEQKKAAQTAADERRKAILEEQRQQQLDDQQASAQAASVRQQGLNSPNADAPVEQTMSRDFLGL